MKLINSIGFKAKRATSPKPALQHLRREVDIQDPRNISSNIHYTVGMIAGSLFSGEAVNPDHKLAYVEFQEQFTALTGFLIEPERFEYLPSKGLLDGALKELNHHVAVSKSLAPKLEACAGASYALESTENIGANVHFVTGGISGTLAQGGRPTKEQVQAYLTYQNLFRQRTGKIIPPQDFTYLPPNSKLEPLLSDLNESGFAKQALTPIQNAVPSMAME